jgi:hypothetical protein
MKTIVINTEDELKRFVNTGRPKITEINGIEFTEMHPMLDISNKHASYYDVETQSNQFIVAPFKITTK